MGLQLPAALVLAAIPLGADGRSVEAQLTYRAHGFDDTIRAEYGATCILAVKAAIDLVDERP